MKRIFIAAAFVTLVTAGALGFASASADAATANCKVETIGTKNGANGPDSKFTITGNRAYIKYKITGDSNCNPTVALKSWYSPSANGQPHAAQKLFQEVDRTPGLGQHQMSVDLPAKGCFFQVDFVKIIPDRQPGEKNEMLGYVLGGNKDCTPVPPTPIYSCDLLSVKTDANRNVSITAFKTSASNGAVYTRSVIGWGDTTYTRATSDVVGKAHQYTNDGTYTISATAFFNANNKERSATSVKCSQTVTFSAGQPPVVQPPVVTVGTSTTGATPTALPNTGPGPIAAVFGGVTTLATAGHMFITRRRLF